MTSSLDSKFTQLLESHRTALRTNDFSAAERVGTAVLNLALDRMMAAAERGDVPEDYLCKVMAHKCEENGDWEGALRAYERALDLANRSSSQFVVWKAHDDLAALHFMLNKAESALSEQQLATDAARQGDSEVVLRMGLIAEASLLLRLGRPAEAAIRIREGLSIPDQEDIDHHGNAALKVLQAECEALDGRIEFARAILQGCQPYLEAACQMPSAAGVHSTMCNWWCVEARCCELENNSANEVDALQKSLAIARQIDQLPHVAGVYSRARVARVLDRLAQALWRNGNIDEAQRVKEQARQIRIGLRLPAESAPRN
jgi:tetratricopeptide (TPR) repeat protein